MESEDKEYKCQEIRRKILRVIGVYRPNQVNIRPYKMPGLTEPSELTEPTPYLTHDTRYEFIRSAWRGVHVEKVFTTTRLNDSRPVQEKPTWQEKIFGVDRKPEKGRIINIFA